MVFIFGELSYCSIFQALFIRVNVITFIFLRFHLQEELSRTLSQTNHDVLPALMEPSAVLEYSAQIYSQVRAFAVPIILLRDSLRGSSTNQE